MLVDENAQNSLESLTMPQGRETIGYLRLKRVPSENSLILLFTLSKRITIITGTSPFLSPLLKAKFRHCFQSKSKLTPLIFCSVNTLPLVTSNRLESNKCCQHTVGDLLHLGIVKRKLKQFQLPTWSRARKQKSKKKSLTSHQKLYLQAMEMRNSSVSKSDLNI